MTIIMLVLMLLTPALTEPGVTYDGGICWEADGTEGVTVVDGRCVTPADYDVMFSFKNLSTIPSIINPEISIAAEAGLVDDGESASQRTLGEGVTKPFTFVEYVTKLHGPVPS